MPNPLGESVMSIVGFLALLFLSHSQAHTLYLLPSFQGTVLHRNGEHVFLAPLTPSTYAQTYSLLIDPETTTSSHTEYPTVTCAPSSHAGHCTPLPAEGAITNLSKLYNISTIPYDWRLSSSQILPALASTILSLPQGAILLAHGTACHLATLLNATNARLVCISPVSLDLAKHAISRGEGLLTLGDAHRYKHPGDTRVPKDFRMMEHELGLVSKRQLLPVKDGPWDERDTFAAPQEARVQLVAKLDSVLEYANGGVLGVGDSSLCIQGTGVGRACDGFLGRLVHVDVGFFDLVGLVQAALKELV